MVGGVFLTRSTLKPLRDLRDAVQRILHTGQTDDRVPVYGTDDAVDELSGLFNAMLARITTLIHGMRNALDHVAHDLRTPMTRLRVTAESALATNDPARHREALVRLPRGIRRVLSMLTTLMDISEAETGTMKLNVSRGRPREARGGSRSSSTKTPPKMRAWRCTSACPPTSPCTPIAIDCGRRWPISSTTRSNTRRAAAASSCRRRRAAMRS